MQGIHEATLRLLPRRHAFSLDNERTLLQREGELGLRLPEALRAWYGLDGSLGILRERSNQDHPIEVASFAVEESGGVARIPIIAENQGVCRWAVRLDDSNDPPVDVQFTHECDWIEVIDAFSRFVYCQVWDNPLFPFGCGAQEDGLRGEDVASLVRRFVEGPQTRGWPGRVNRRYGDKTTRIIIWESDAGADWTILSADERSMESVLRAIWPLGGLSRNLYGHDPFSIGLIDALRHASSTTY